MTRYNKVDYAKREDYHRFVDEAGDTTFFKKGKVPVEFGENGVSRYLILGMVHIKDPLPEAEQRIRDFGKTIEQDEFFNVVPSVQKRIQKYGYFIPHAKDDPPELKLAFFKFLAGEEINFSLQTVLGRKNFERFAKAHNGKEKELYADLMAHLLHDKANYEKLVVNVASRVNSTDNTNLSGSLARAKQRYTNRIKKEFTADIRFNVQPYSALPLLSVIDYSLWAVQRLVERDDERYYKLIAHKVPYVLDAFASRGQQRAFMRDASGIKAGDLRGRT